MTRWVSLDEADAVNAATEAVLALQDTHNGNVVVHAAINVLSLTLARHPTLRDLFVHEIGAATEFYARQLAAEVKP